MKILAQRTLHFHNIISIWFYYVKQFHIAVYNKQMNINATFIITTKDEDYICLN